MVRSDSSWANRHVKTKLVSHCFKTFLFSVVKMWWVERQDQRYIYTPCMQLVVLGPFCINWILMDCSCHWSFMYSAGLPRWGMSSDQVPHMTYSKSHIYVEVIQNTARFQWPHSAHGPSSQSLYWMLCCPLSALSQGCVCHSWITEVIYFLCTSSIV